MPMAHQCDIPYVFACIHFHGFSSERSHESNTAEIVGSTQGWAMGLSFGLKNWACHKSRGDGCPHPSGRATARREVRPRGSDILVRPGIARLNVTMERWPSSPVQFRGTCVIAVFHRYYGRLSSMIRTRFTVILLLAAAASAQQSAPSK